MNITWNVTEELYLLEPWTYQALVAANPNFTFTLANGTSKVDITVPYAALDLNVVLPINRVVPRNQTQKYFPVKRSTDKSQYTLGRAFLQEAYLQVDYHRRIFNISQAAWPESDFASDPKPLYPPNNNTQTATADPKNSTSISNGLSQSQKNGAIAGGVIGGVLLLCALLLVATRVRTGQWWPLGFGKRRSAVPVQVPELDAKKELVEAEGDTRQPEELDAGRDGGVAEMEAQERSPSELAKMRQEYTGS